MSGITRMADAILLWLSDGFALVSAGVPKATALRMLIHD